MARNRRYVEFNKDGLPPPATEVVAPPAPVVKVVDSAYDSNLEFLPVPSGRMLRSFLPIARVASVEYVNRVEYGRPDPGLQNYTKPAGTIPWGASLLDDDDPAAARAVEYVKEAFDLGAGQSITVQSDGTNWVEVPTPINTPLWRRVKALINADDKIELADAGLVDWELDSLEDFDASMQCGQPITETREAVIKMICDNCKLKDTPY